MEQSKANLSSFLLNLFVTLQYSQQHNIIFMFQYDSSVACLNISVLLCEAIPFMLNANQTSVALDCQIYLMALLKDLVDFGDDPRPSLAVLLQAFRHSNDQLGETSSDFFNYSLILLSELLHIVSPVYLDNVLRLLKV